MVSKFSLVLLLLAFPSCCSSRTWIRAGYWYAGSEFPVPDVNSALFTHLICAFAHVNSSTYQVSMAASDEPYMATFASIVKRRNPSVVPLLSIWVRDDSSDNSMFFPMVNSSSNRKSFIDSSIATARAYGFEGLDLWGHAALLNATGNMTDVGTFFDEWRVAVNTESKNTNRAQLVLTHAAHYSPELNSVTYPIDSLKRNLDFVHLISYDYHTPLIENFTGAHAALYDPASNLNTDYGINEWIKRGFPVSMLVIGLPYHGYAWTLLDPKNGGFGARAKGLAITTDGSMSYSYIKNYLRSYKTDSIYNSTYVENYCVIGSFWIGYDDEEAIRTKVAYAKKKGLLGYNVFQVPNDNNWVLSTIAADEVGRSSHRGFKLKIILPFLAASVLVLVCIIWFIRRRSVRPDASEIEEKDQSESPHLQEFKLNEIKAATRNFREENMLGEGGYGPVYKGKLPNEQEIAVKRLSESSKQGLEEFRNEVTLTAKLQHVNLVRLLGICTEREENMLIYEYMPNKSLDFYLFDPSRRSLLGWERWVKIIEGITQGLLYLQEYSRLTIIHRDLKASNILLDADMKPKISDFGIARSFKKDENEASTSRIIGTYGYAPPEYVKGGMYSRKYDVYSFGVLLLQIISGKKNNCVYGPDRNLSLLEYAYNLWKEGRGMEFVDPLLDDSSSACKLIRCMQVALLCVEEKWELRPTMLEVSSMLRNEFESIPAPRKPAFSKNKDDTEENKTTSTEEVSSVNFATTSLLFPR